MPEKTVQSHLMKLCTISFFIIIIFILSLLLLSSLRAQLCKAVTKLPLDFCVTKPSRTAFPVYVWNLVGIPLMLPLSTSSTGCMFSRRRSLFF